MAKHNDREFTERMKFAFRDGYNKTLRDGIARGAYAVCRVVTDKAADETKSAEERLDEIVKFCSTFAKLRDSVEEPVVKEDAQDGGRQDEV